MFEFLNTKQFKKFKEEALFTKLQRNVREIAVYKGGGGLGDLVAGIRLFSAFKKAFPQARISYMGVIYPRFEKIFRSIPVIDGYINYRRPDKGKGMRDYFKFRRKWKGKIDLLVDTQRRWETSFWLKMLGSRYMVSSSPLLSDWPMPPLDYKKMHVLEHLLVLPARLGIQDVERLDSGIHVAEEFRNNAETLLKKYPRKLVALLPSCGMEYKNWMPEYFAQLGDLFTKQGYQNILLGSPKELGLFRDIASRMERKPIIPAAMDMSFAKELMNDAAVLERCDIAVGNDSGGMQMASCLGVLSATIFGPTTPRKFSPVGQHNIIFYQPTPCSPCRFKCHNRIYKECLKRITPEEVFNACMKGLRQKAEK